MKAVFITNKPSPYQVRFCEALQSQMDMTYLFCMDLNNENHSYWKLDLPEKCKMLDRKKRLLIQKGRFYRYMNFDIFSELDSISPDIVMIGDFSHPTCYAAYRWCKKNKIKVVFFREIAKNKRILNLYSKLYSKADALFVVGKQAVELYSQYFKNTKVYNFSYAADIEKKLSYKRSEYNGIVRFLFASRYVAEHRPKLVIDAFKKIADRYDNVQLTMSSRGALMEECEQYAEACGLEGKVIFKNHLSSWDEVNNLYIENDILVFPGFSTWGLVIPEAMAAGMAVIASKEVTAAELLPSDSLVIPELDHLVAHMERFIRNPDLIRTEGQRNRELSKTESFSSKSVQLKSLFEKVLMSDKED